MTINNLLMREKQMQYPTFYTDLEIGRCSNCGDLEEVFGEVSWQQNGEESVTEEDICCKCIADEFQVSIWTVILWSKVSPDSLDWWLKGYYKLPPAKAFEKEFGFIPPSMAKEYRLI